jgi:threonine dehydrogenase-like Zn-dependent dehydrogenase
MPSGKASSSERSGCRTETAIEAYRAFDKREPGWIKVELKPTAAA